MAAHAAHARWLDVWTRAVIVPAWRRAAAVWAGCAVVAVVAFGPNGIAPGQLTALALRSPAVGALLAVTWLLVFAPIARLLVRGDGARYLRSLPGPTVAPIVLALGALVVLQAPWAALWILGEGALGLAVIAAVTVPLVVLARWRPRAMRARWPGWTDDAAALRAIHLRALRRRAGDALLRGAGLAVLAGAAAGLFVRNNGLAGPDAATLGASVLAVMLVPAEVGVLLVILATHRETAWLAASLGTSRAARTGAVVATIAVVELAATALAIAGVWLVAEPDLATLAWLAAVSGAVAIGSALGRARVLLAAEDSPTIAARAVVGSVAIAALAVLALGLLDEVGALAVVAAGVLALSSPRVGGRA